MRQSEMPLDPEVAAELEAIDATLRGEAVDPIYAELAELSLLLAAERPVLADEASLRLDERVSAARPEVGRRRFAWRPALAVGLPALVALAVAVVIVGQSGSPRTFNGSVGASAPADRTLTGVHAAAGSSGSAKAPASERLSSKSIGTATYGPATQGALGAAAPGLATPTPPSNGRAIIQSAQLALSTRRGRIDTVAQEVFNVVGHENGVVKSSQITAGGPGGGYASFSLSIPSAKLSDTLNQLSALPYARVASRTDSTQDVNGRYLNIRHRLQDARALRTSLLGQLAAATTAEQVASLTAQIHDAEASIASDEATLRGLQSQIDFSSLTVTVNQLGPIPVDQPPSTGSGGFTLGRAAHDALRVLTVAAGVILIALAALVPVALLVALALWLATASRRRRREQALDAA